MSQVGQFIGSYEIVRLLGQGGMGQVYLGRHRETGKQVAIKVVLPEALKENPDFLERFRREGEALSRLNHPNIVKMVEVIQTEQQSCIVLEYVDGGTLADLIEKNGPLPIEQALDIGIELADALTRAHHLKIIHRDIKPSNILLTSDGKPRLTDFGLVRMDTEDNLTRTGILVGSVGYLSPEALNNAPTDPRMDIWAFGVVLYEMLAGRRPFEGGTNTATLAAILTEPVPDISQFRADLPLPLVILVEQMLEKKPAFRTASARQVGAELEKVRQTLGESPRAEYTPDAQARRKSQTLTILDTSLTKTWENSDATVIAPTPLLFIRQASNRGSRGFILALVALVVLAVGFYFAYENLKSKPNADAFDVVEVSPADGENDLLILVGILEPLGDEKIEINRFILEDLRETLEIGTAYLPLSIREYPKMITTTEQATQAADANHAGMVIWGNYDDDLIEINIQLNDYGVMQLPEKFLTETGNVRIRLTNARQQSIVPQVLIGAAIWQSIKGDAYESAAALLTYEELSLEQGEIMGVTVGTNVYRHYETLYSDTSAAVEALDAALRVSPSNPMLYHLRAAALDRLDRTTEAKQDIQTAILLSDDTWIIPYINISNIEVSDGHIDEAIQQLNRATQINPDDWLPYTMRGSFYFLAGDYEDAKIDLIASTERQPKANFPYVLLMNIAVREGELDSITDLMQTVLNQFPDPTLANRVILTAGNQPEYGGFYSALLSAFSNMALKQYDAAITDLEAAVKLRADIAEIFLFQGIAYCANGDYEKSEAAYTQGLELDPDFTVLYLLRADVRSRLNKLGDSLLDFGAAQATTQWEKFEPFINQTLTSDSNALGCESFFG